MNDFFDVVGTELLKKKNYRFSTSGDGLPIIKCNFCPRAIPLRPTQEMIELARKYPAIVDHDCGIDQWLEHFTDSYGSAD